LLVVDDDADVRSTTALLLRRMGYTVLEAQDAQEALDILAATPAIDLLLTDVVMPEVNGPELSRRALDLRPDLPVVFFSGYADPEAIAGAAPLSRLLRKPFRPAELAALIESALSEHATLERFRVD
jgi:CheY-like chemotaxis protein